MASTLIDDLIDLKGHCLVCFRECTTDSSEQFSGRSDIDQDDVKKLHANHNAELCKRFLKLLSRYLRIPMASLHVFYDNEDTPRNIHTRWDTLINASICDDCKKHLVDPICNLYAQMDYINMQLQLKVQELVEFIDFTNQDGSYRNARMGLHQKWVEEEQDSHHFFKLLDLLKTEISTKSEKRKKFPLVALKQIPDPDKYHRKVITAKDQPEHRHSVEDSGVSLNSGLSPASASSFEDQSSAMCQLDENETVSKPAKEHRTMRRVFTCKVCREKHFSRENLDAHYFATHPKPTITSTTNSSTDCPSPERKVFKIRKTVYLCHVDGCDAKFMNKELFMQHSTNGHPPKTPENVSHHDGIEKTNVKLQAVKCSVEGCLETFHNAEQLLLHAQFHLNHQCGFCSKIFKGPALLAGHELRAHKEPGTSVVKNIKCPRCSKVLTTYHNYRDHFYATHLGVKAPTFKCSMCSAIFVSVASRKRHMTKGCPKIQSSVKKQSKAALINPPTPAAYPNNTFQNIDQVKSTETKRHVCNICCLSVSSFTALHSHIVASHDSNMEYCPDCERMFKDGSSLAKHRAQIHLKFKIYVKYCKYCAAKKTFKGLSKFAAHLKAHEDILEGKRYVQECPTCHKKFKNLGSHMRAHAVKKQQDNFPEPNSSSVNADSLEHYNNIEGKGNLADRIKLRRGRSVSSQRQTRHYEFDDDKLTSKRRGKKGKRRKSKRLTSSAPLYYNEEFDGDGSNKQAAKRRKPAREPANCNNQHQQEKEHQSESPNQRKFRSPSKRTPSPQRMHPSQRDTGESSNHRKSRSPSKKTPPSQEDTGESSNQRKSRSLSKKTPPPPQCMPPSQRDTGESSNQRKSRSSSKKTPPPQRMPPNQEDTGESCTSNETVVLSKTVTSPNKEIEKRTRFNVSSAMKPESDKEPGCSQIPQINARLQTWMNKVKMTNGGMSLSSSLSKPVVLDTTEKLIPKVVDYVLLSDDEEEETKVDPKLDPSTKADLTKRVDSWLSGRGPNEEDIITID